MQDEILKKLKLEITDGIAENIADNNIAENLQKIMQIPIYSQEIKCSSNESKKFISMKRLKSYWIKKPSIIMPCLCCKREYKLGHIFRMTKNRFQLNPTFSFVAFGGFFLFQNDEFESRRCIGIWRTIPQFDVSKIPLKFNIIQVTYSFEYLQVYEDDLKYLNECGKQAVNFGTILYEIYLKDLKLLTVLKPFSKKSILHIVEHYYIPEKITKINPQNYSNNDIQNLVRELLETKIQQKFESCNTVSLSVSIYK